MLEERHEIIEFSHNTPIKLFIHKLGDVHKHWHQSLELLMVLEGNVQIIIDKEVYLLESNDLVLINTNSIHELHSEGCIMIAIQIKLSRFDNTSLDLNHLYFDCNSVKDNNTSQYDILRSIIAIMIKENANKSEGMDYRNISLSYYLLAELISNFKTENVKDVAKSQKHLARLTRILTYINEHYHENFSLNQLAEIENLSVPYLSSFFDKYMGISFSQYYTNIKLDHAQIDLLSTNDTIENIAIKHGFTEPHAFVRAFKKKHNILPSIYRKEKGESSFVAKKNLVNYLSLEPSNYLHLLAKYLDTNSPIMYHNKSSLSENLNIDIDTRKSTKTLTHSFKKFISVGRASELLNVDIQNMLKDLQENIGYEFIKFHGILSDDMMVCHRHNQELKFNFTLVDMILDFILSIGLKPLIQLSFMPQALAKDPEKTVFFAKFITSPPKNILEWNFLVQEFTNHLIERYGINQVKSWLFCVWNEPDTSEIMFGFTDNRDFYELYQNTYQTVKAINKDIIFGSPSILLITESSRDWAKKFLYWTDTNNCRPDFLNVHYYSDQFNNRQFNASHLSSTTLPKDANDFNKYIATTKGIFDSLNMSDLPIYLTEWNFTVSHRNLINDTCFKSCYILRNLLKNYDSLDSFGYWSLTDLLAENPLPDHLFHGGMGLYTINGIRKSAFYAFYFANMLGNTLLCSGDGYFVTKSEDSFIIITYNYQHYSNLFAEGENFDMTLLNRYTHFNMSNKLDLSLTLTNVNNNKYLVKEYYVNMNNGSAFDKWVQFGGLPLSKEDSKLLSSQSEPAFGQYIYTATNNTLVYSAQLEPHEIRLTCIKTIN